MNVEWVKIRSMVFPELFSLLASLINEKETSRGLFSIRNLKKVTFLAGVVPNIGIRSLPPLASII